MWIFPEVYYIYVRTRNIHNQLSRRYVTKEIRLQIARKMMKTHNSMYHFKMCIYVDIRTEVLYGFYIWIELNHLTSGCVDLFHILNPRCMILISCRHQDKFSLMSVPSAIKSPSVPFVTTTLAWNYNRLADFIRCNTTASTFIQSYKYVSAQILNVVANISVFDTVVIYSTLLIFRSIFSPTKIA